MVTAKNRASDGGFLAVALTSVAGWAMAQDPQAEPPTQPQQQPAPAAKDTKDTKEMAADALTGKESVTSIEKSKSATPEK